MYLSNVYSNTEETKKKFLNSNGIFHFISRIKVHTGCNILYTNVPPMYWERREHVGKRWKNGWLNCSFNLVLHAQIKLVSENFFPLFIFFLRSRSCLGEIEGMRKREKTSTLDPSKKAVKLELK